MASAPVKGKGTFSRFSEFWNPINPVSDGKKDGDIDDKIISVAFEAKEETDTLI